MNRIKVIRPTESRISYHAVLFWQAVCQIHVSRGLHEETVDFQGRKRHLFVIEQKALDGDVVVSKFENGLIYRSQTPEGYALLERVEMPGF
ncbi:MAG: hypothetical protein ACOH5I_23155 [Oligoflexus sp.]